MKTKHLALSKISSLSAHDDDDDVSFVASASDGDVAFGCTAKEKHADTSLVNALNASAVNVASAIEEISKTRIA